MARKLDKSAPPAAPQGAVGADDMAIMHPDREVFIAGVLVTVHEYRFWEGLKLRALAKPFLDDLYVLFSAAGSAPAFEDVADLFGAHETVVQEMVAQASGQKREWIQRLGDQDGDALLLTWWLVNSGFFIRRLLRRTAQERLAPGNLSAGPASSTRSSKRATSAASTSSAR